MQRGQIMSNNVWPLCWRNKRWTEKGHPSRKLCHPSYQGQPSPTRPHFTLLYSQQLAHSPVLLLAEVRHPAAATMCPLVFLPHSPLNDKVREEGRTRSRSHSALFILRPWNMRDQVIPPKSKLQSYTATWCSVSELLSPASPFTPGTSRQRAG